MNYLKTIAIFGLLGAAAAPAAAHDFWIEPADFHLGAPGSSTVELRVGHLEDQENWPAVLDRIVSFKSYAAHGIQDYQAGLTGSREQIDLPVQFDEPGAYFVTLESQRSFSELEAEKFNDYVEEEGVVPIEVDRVRNRTTEEAGRELYARRGKALVTVGELDDADREFITKPLGLSLEIIPMSLPQDAQVGETVDFKLLYRGQPISGASVHVVSLTPGEGELPKLTSDEDGLIHMARPETGAWMLHTVWAAPMMERDDAEYDTLFGSLTFDVDPE